MAVINGTGAVDTLKGSNSGDTINGLAGADTMTGRNGGDLYIVDDVNDVIVEVSGQGIDAVLSSAANYTLSANIENLSLDGSANINAVGNTLNNRMWGNSGNNTLDGGNGYDILTGDAGNDTYVVDSALDMLYDTTGTDTVVAAASWSLGALYENLSLSGGSSINAIGNTLVNTITGNAGNNTLDGGAGNDMLIGGGGNDTYIISGLGDVLTELAGQGTDTVRSAFTYTLAAEFENLVLTGSTNLDGTGNSVANVLTGNTGINTLTGGAGNDTYVVQNTADVVVENAAEGTDIVESSATFTLSANIENLTLTGNAIINGTGNAAVNTITGNDTDNTLIGLAGNDTLNGGLGADVLIGGADNDLYIVNDDFDVVVENNGEGTDTVESTVTFTLGDNVENLSLTGSSAVNAFGNSGVNILTGNSGNNTLYGFGGDDTLNGGGGVDTYIVNSAGDVVISGGGIDTVLSTIDYTLGAGIESLTLQGSADLDGAGNGLDNTLTGNLGINTLTGGAGNDNYIVQNDDDIIVELNGGGTQDSVQSTVSYTLGAEIENITLLGTATINATGNILNNSITGNSGRNTLAGGLGDDVYYVNLTTDRVVENAAEGNDKTHSTANFYALRNNVEILQLDGIANINGDGNALDNTIIGNVGNNIINGLAGNDVVTGDTGRDTISGGDGDDVISGGDGNDTLIGGNGNDTLSGNSGIDRMEGGADDDTYSVDSAGDITVDTSGYDIVNSTVSYVLGTGIEELNLLNPGLSGTGNELNNVINADAGENRLDGKAGADTMSGGDGNDTYVVDNVNDEVIETSGFNNTVTSFFQYKEGRVTYTLSVDYAIDIIESSVSYSLATLGLTNVEVLRLTGTANLNATGNILDNILIGNIGRNTLTGGDGDDAYGYNNPGDIIVELAGEGTDTVLSSISYTLGANLENIFLSQGAGAINATGDSGNNFLKGNESINILNGGGGHDKYEVTAGDIIIDSSGNDTIVSLVSDWTLQNGIEHLDLFELTSTGIVGSAIRGTGNSAGNFIRGNNASNTLDGGLGSDILQGFLGNDLYIVDSLGDFVDEDAGGGGGGTDTVISSVDFNLGTDLENLTFTGTSVLAGTGNGGSNTMIGNNAASTLSGNGGIDTYIVSHSGTVINESGGEIDRVESSVSYVLAASVENMVLTGAAAINGTGNAEVNTITGNSGANTISGLGGNDTLDGGSGVDLLIGGAGDDHYFVENTSDAITELAAEGVDLVSSKARSYTLSANVENLALELSPIALIGIGNDLDNHITGNTNKNILTGGAGNDTLDGGTGADTMEGGLGDDTFFVDLGLDVVTDTGGLDTVHSSSVLYTLRDGLENLVLIDGAISGTGNAAVNTITGTGNANTLSGGGGVDTLQGLAGNDTYITDADDVIIEAGGIDTIVIGTTYTLGVNFENLTLSGVLAIDGTGNDEDNILTGNKMNNTLSGLVGDDTLAGGLGIDTLIGGVGDDVYTITDSRAVIVEVVEEGDEDVINAAVNYTMGAGVHVETLNLTGKTANGTGNELDNIINGNDAVNVLIGNDGHDTLDGKLGADRMVGGLGDDIYYVSMNKDVVTELLNQGKDTVVTTVQKYTLGANIEVLFLVAGDNFFQVGIGNTLDNTLNGSTGIDSLDGKTGADLMQGGEGDDFYFIDNVGDVAFEYANEGNDTVSSTISHTIYSHVEGLVLTGTAAIDGTGNSLNNVINGNTGANILSGLDGNDTLDGKVGIDTMIGGLGDDVFFVDHISDVVTEIADEGTDTVNATLNYTLGVTLENLTLLGRAAIGTGNDLDNTLIGSFGANTLFGGLGDDRLDGSNGIDKLYGGLGNDTYVIETKGDLVVENASEGIDTVRAAMTYTLVDNVENLTLTSTFKVNATGNALDNVIIGGTNDNIIDGKAGADTMTGGTGNDTYYIDNIGDSVNELLSGGTDKVISSVSYRLSAHVENLTLAVGTLAINGTGNDLKNIIIGNAGNNILDGRVGADTMSGGAGNDIYYVDNIKDVVTDTGGVDMVYSSATHTMATGIESLEITGFADVNVTGNASANTITGNEGNNSINGGGGIDTMAGGLGDDTYVVDVAGDVVTENASEGRDTIQSNLTYTLAANFENLTLLGKAAIHGTGNAEDNSIVGNVAANTLSGDAGEDALFGGGGNDLLLGGFGDDILYGQAGADILTGGAGADFFTFEVTSAYSGIDTITDFDIGSNDALDLRDVLFVYDPSDVTNFLTDFVRISDSTTNSTVEIDRDGLGTAFGWTQVAVLQGVTGLTDEALLVTNGNLLV